MVIVLRKTKFYDNLKCYVLIIVGEFVFIFSVEIARIVFIVFGLDSEQRVWEKKNAINCENVNVSCERM